MSGYSVNLSWAAQYHLRALEYGTGNEIAAGMLGRVCGKTVEVDAIVAGLEGPFNPWEAPLEMRYWASFERFYGDDEDELRLVGDLHSHEFLDPRPSDVDYTHWQRISHAPGQPQATYAGLILSPRGELPSGEMDWSEPRMGAWVAVAGELWTASISLQPRWLAELESQVQMQPRRSHA